MTQMTQTIKLYRDHLICDSQLVVIFDWGSPITVMKGNERFEHIKSLLENGDTHNIADEVDQAFNLQKKMRGKFTVVGGLIEIDGELIPESLSDMLLKFLDANLDTAPLENFYENLKLNTVESARKDLFDFLRVNKVPLTVDGHFVAYKKVREDWWDSYTGRTHQNLPGVTIKMDRDKVDNDRRNTCSAGLHVAAWGYASGFTGTRTLMVKVNPRDVVAVPPDYNQQKMRVCQYLVLGETSEPYAQSIYEEAMVDDTPTSELEEDVEEVENDYEADEFDDDDYDDFSY